LGIDAGLGIEAGWGIKAGWGISCKCVLKWSYQLFAGVITCRQSTPEDRRIVCGRAEGGTVECGELFETGIPPTQQPCGSKLATLIVDGKSYEATVRWMD